jgi:ATP-dependent Zn protease
MRIKEDVNSKTLAKMTPNMTGADIACLVNNAIVNCVDLGVEELTYKAFEEAIDRVLLGLKRKRPYKTKNQAFQSAVHQAGHTIVCYNNKICRNNLRRVTIEHFGESKGEVLILADEKQLTKEDLLSLIDMYLGGVIAEEIVFGKNHVASGCGKDLNKAGKVVDELVKRLGMSVEWGFSIVDEGKNLKNEHKISQTSRNVIDAACQDVLKDSEKRVRRIISQNVEKLKDLAEKLEKERTIMKGEMVEIFRENQENENLITSNENYRFLHYQELVKYFIFNKYK